MQFFAILAQRIPAPLLLGLLAALPGFGAPLYQITFNGLIQSGTLKNTDTSQVQFSTDFLAGATISATMLFDLGLAPAPTITDLTDGKQTALASSTSPIWVGGSVTLQLPDQPADALPVPSTFLLAPRPAPSGATDLFTPLRNQNLSLSYITCCSAVLASANYSDSWLLNGLEAQQHSLLLGVLITASEQFLPQVPGVVSSFVAPASVGGSTFQALGFSRDLTDPNPPLFGIKENYVLSTTFFVTDAVGSFVDTAAPEPGTWLAGLTGLTLLRLRRRH